ncbi:MAG: ATP-binding protein [Elusimicrobiales bacterium]|jgi:signal transduction histidine kinase
MKRTGDLAIKISALFVLVVFAVIAWTAGYILKDAKTNLLADMSARTGSFARSSREAFSPKLDRFWLHFLVNEFARTKAARYVLISDAGGKILSHSLPERIGEIDNTPEGRAARKASGPLMRAFHGADNLDYYYFSAPITLGGKRLGTAAAAVNTVTIDASLSDTRKKLAVILLAALLALVMIAAIMVLIRREQRAAKLKSDMVHLVSHEFNNALATIDACIFLLEETEPAGSDQSRSGVYRTLADSRKSLRLYVKNILNEARMESGKFRIEKVPLALIDLTEESMTAMNELIRQKSIAVSMHLPRGCRLLVSADQEALAIVIANLIGNAVKYTPKNGKVKVRIIPHEDTPQMVIFQVENTGAGISKDDIERIKAGFYRTEDGRAAAAGFGLGLKISNQLLLLHGSRLEIESEQGKYSRFHFSLPILSTTCALEKKPIPRHKEKPA